MPLADPAARREYQKAWVLANKEKMRDLQKSWWLRNPDKAAQYERERWERAPEKVLAKNALRHARKLRATPPWLTDAHKAEIEALYQCGALFRYDVDHIEPLQGKDVCGLHVPWNLQVLPPSENRSKGNRRPTIH